VPLWDSFSCEVEQSGDGEGGGVEGLVMTRVGRKVLRRTRTDQS